jgi:signal transduction histidine kinase
VSTIARRVRWSVIGVAALSVAVVFGVFYLAWRAYTVSTASADLARQVGIIAKGFEAAERRSGTTSASELATRLFRAEAGLLNVRLVVTDANGSELESSAATGSAQRLRYPLGALGSTRPDGTRRAVAAVPPVGQTLLVAYPLSGGRELIAIQPLREIRQARGWVIVLLAASAFAALVVAWAVGWLLARRITRPITRLEQAAETLGRGEWGHQVPVEGEDEVASLARSFNAMSTRLGDAYAAQAAFVGDVSHELRTPITSIQGFARALTDGTVVEPEQQRRYLGVIRDEASRLGDLTRTLLSLADLEAGAVRLEHTPVDVPNLAEALRARYEAPAADRGLNLRVESLSGAPLGDAARLLQVASALVDNALAYTPAPGTVLVRSSWENNRWRLHVEDSGPGIPAEERQRVFERFARLDASRSAAGGGSGLGLAIARRIVELMSGEVWIESSALGGAEFVVELPSA